jgi:sec-independent protein translocase protein TatC
MAMTSSTTVAEPTPDVPEEEMGGMALIDHVREIRDRVFRCVIALVIGSAIGFAVSERALQILIQPYGGDKLLITDPTEALTNVFTVSLTISMTLALPFILFQVLGFIMPGLYDHEKRGIYIGLPFGFILFITGVAFAWFVMVPNGLSFLKNIYPSVFNSQWKAENYIPFVTGLLFWIGVAFEMPLIMYLLARANVITGRLLVKNWRYAVVIIAIISAVITPTPDPINMGLVMAPLLVLYGFSILLAFFARRGKTIPAILDPDGK